MKQTSGSYEPATYSPKNFYLKSTDNRGHSHPVRVSDGLVAPLTEVVQDPRYPYRSWQDFVRDALVHRLHTLKEGEELVDGVVSPGTEAALARIHLEEMISATKALAETKELLVEAVSEGVRIDKNTVMVLAKGLTEAQQVEFANWVKGHLIPMMDEGNVNG